MSSDQETPPGVVPADAHAALVAAYYPRALEAAEAARARAQNGWAIAIAAAGGLFGFGAVSEFADRGSLLLGLGLVTVCLWIFAALLFAWTVSSPADPEKQARSVPKEKFAETVLDLVRQERDEVYRRQRIAFFAATAALVITLVTTGVAQTTPGRTRVGALLLTTDGQLALATDCPTLKKRLPLSGRIDVASIGENDIAIHVSRGLCGAGETDLRIPRDEVRAVILK